jgi:hypothetical protein
MYAPAPNFLDEARAKTFRICLYLLSKQVPEYYLAGPNLSEKHFGDGMKEYLRSNKIQVKIVAFEPTKRIRVDAYASKIKEHIDELPIAPTVEVNTRKKVSERICDMVDYLGLTEHATNPHNY